MLGTLTPVPQIDPTELARTLTLNVSANQALIAAFDRMMRTAPDARLFAVTSSVGTSPRAFWGGYAASKAALESLVLCYGEEVRRFGIRVAVVDPRRYPHFHARGRLPRRGPGRGQAAGRGRRGDRAAGGRGSGRRAFRTRVEGA